MAGAPLWLIISTVAVYCGFLVGFGETVFDTGFGFETGSCSGFFDCIGSFFGDVADVTGLLGDFAQFITLGGFESPLPPLIQGILLLFFGIAWIAVIVDIVLP